MYFLSILSLALVTQLGFAVAGPQITAAAVLRRQNNDPYLVGWVSTSGQSSFSVDRSCDFPATLSRSGSYAQCCAPTGSCPFFTACNGGTLLAAQTSVYCDQGYCNTGVVVASIGANNGGSFLGCWPTDYGTAAFDLVQNTMAAASAAPTGNVASSPASGSGSGSNPSTVVGVSDSPSSGRSATATIIAKTGTASTSTSTSTSTGTKNAAASTSVPAPGFIGLAAAVLALL